MSDYSLVRITKDTADKARKIRKIKRVYAEAVFAEAIDMLYEKTFTHKSKLDQVEKHAIMVGSALHSIHESLGDAVQAITELHASYGNDVAEHPAYPEYDPNSSDPWQFATKAFAFKDKDMRRYYIIKV